MCGFVGILNKDNGAPVNAQLLAAMSDLIAHRGPDDDGQYLDGPIGLAHRRLAVLDLSRLGHQPMIDQHTGSALVYNGELYNYRELRRLLQHQGCQFRSNCDTEVLLYSDFSDSAWMQALNGMFAFAAWEAGSKTLWLGRDPLGIKPLYYCDLPDVFIFGSEIKPLLLHPDLRPEVNVERIPEYLAFRGIHGGETMYRGIFEFPPGHVMKICHSSGRRELVRYYDPEFRHVAGMATGQAGVDEFIETLVGAVKCQLISDVPVGTYNSGGVDSSLVTATAKELTGGELHTFSVGFEEPEFDESPYADIVAKRFQTRHHRLVISQRDYVDAYEQALDCMAEPINHAHTVQLMLLSRYARELVTVVLTGEGADELFAGYPRLQIPMLARYLRYLPKVISRSALELARSYDRRLAKLLESSSDQAKSIVENARYVPEDDLYRLIPTLLELNHRHATMNEAQSRCSSLLSQVLYYEQRTYLPPLLSRLDKVSMAFGLECRVPFLDRSMVEFSFQVADRMKLRLGRENKLVVKKAAEKWLPDRLIYRPKSGFGTPVGLWMRDKAGLGRYLDLLHDRTFRERGYFEPDAISRIVSDHLDGRSDHSELIWGLMNLELWCRRFIDERSNAIPLRRSIAVT